MRDKAASAGPAQSSGKIPAKAAMTAQRKRTPYPSADKTQNNAGEGPGAGSKITGDKGDYAQPALLGAAKAAQRARESAYTSSNAQRDSAAGSLQSAIDAAHQSGKDPNAG
jgi:hypothetical protein